MTKPTPGEWTRGPENAGDGLNIMATVNGRAVCIGHTSRVMHGGRAIVSEDEAKANARVFSAAADMAEALRLTEVAEQIHANCKECETEVAPELCEACFPAADAARVARRAAFAKAEGR